MLYVIAAVIAIPIFGAFYLKIAKVRSTDRLLRRMHVEIRTRLELIAPDVGGTLVDGPALQTEAGKLRLVASRAPKDATIDQAWFTAKVPSVHSLSIMPAEAAPGVAFKNLKPFTSKDPDWAAAGYKLLDCDEGFAATLLTPDLARALKAVDQAVGGRCSLQVFPGGLTVFAFRGLASYDQLRGFCNTCAGLAQFIRTRLARESP